MEAIRHSTTRISEQSSIVERVMTPSEIRKIRSRNRRLNVLSQSNPAEYEKQLQIWEQEIQAGLNSLKGRVVTTSVVIPAYNEQAEILQPLAALCRQDYDKGLEVIVVVNNSTDRTAEIARACGAEVIEYGLSDEERKTLAPIAVARQRGLEASRGTYVISTDADTIFRSVWVRTLTQLLENPGISLATGRGYALDTNRTLEFAARSATILRRVKIMILGHTHAGGIGPGANTAMRRLDALRVGGYDLHTYPGEDTDMAVKLMELGKPAFPFSNDQAVWTSPRRLGAVSIRDLAMEQVKTIFTKKRGDLLTQQYGSKDDPINYR